MALAVAQAEGRLRRGDRVLLLGSGAGLSLAAALLRW
jgi:3-oxoacyl-[acyl-carrier-protein] synthase III